MSTTKKVDILLSVYNPNTDYLIAQLQSLEAQTYNNIEILLFDDCTDKRCDVNLFAKYLPTKQYRLLPYQEHNLGYTKAFETLVRASTGDYIAFCDQDDIWDPQKIEKCINTMMREGTILVATDRKIIDEHNHIVCPSVRHNSKSHHETWHSYEDIGLINFFTTCAPGMSLVLDGTLARTMVPFSKYTGHDKWVIQCANALGKLSYLDEPLVSYRRHSNNVSAVLGGIIDKKDYEKQRIIPHLRLVQEFRKRYPSYPGNDKALRFALARKKRNILVMFKNRAIAPSIVYFEILLTLLPNPLVKVVIRLLRKRRL